MKFTGKKDNLLRAISLAGHLATTRATLPILQNLYLETTKSHLIVKSTDLEQTLEIMVDGEVGETGEITIPARLLVDYIQNNPDPELTFQLTELTLEITSAHHRAKMIGLSAEDYPSIPQIKITDSTTLPGTTLKSLISRALFASSVSDTQPVLNSLLWRFQDQKLTVVATDGYRLAMTSVEVKANFSGDYILPRRTLQELDKLLTDQDVEIGFTNSQVRFGVGQTFLTSRVLDGSFPAYETIIPKKQTLEVKVIATQLLQSLKLASLFSRDSAYSTKLQLEGETLTVTALSPQFGENSNEVKLTSPIASPLMISLNAQYLIDVLSTLTGEVKLSFSDQNSPIVLTLPDSKDYLYLVMPLRSD